MGIDGPPVVGIVLGSKSDEDIVGESGMTGILDNLGIKWEMSILSAHRNSEELRQYVMENKSGVDVYIAVAGMAAALPGMIASITLMVPVIGVPLASSESPEATDALLSMVRMPPGVPVLTSGIGKAGLVNAALAAGRIFATTGWDDVAIRLHNYCEKAADKKPPMVRYNTSKSTEEVQA